MILKTGLAPGSFAPDFTLNDFYRKPWRLREAQRKGPVVIVFFRGGWCPYCSAYLRRVQGELAEKVAALGGSIVAISSDSPGIPSEEVDKKALSFPVLSDPDGKVLDLFNAANHLSPSEYAAEKQWHDIEAYSLNKLHIIAVPGVTVLDQDGKVIFNELNLDLQKRPEPAAVLRVLKGA